MFSMSVKTLLINTLKETIDCGYLKLILLKSAPWETVEQCQIISIKPSIKYIKTVLREPNSSPNYGLVEKGC